MLCYVGTSCQLKDTLFFLLLTSKTICMSYTIWQKMWQIINTYIFFKILWYDTVSQLYSRTFFSMKSENRCLSVHIRTLDNILNWFSTFITKIHVGTDFWDTLTAVQSQVSDMLWYRWLYYLSIIFVLNIIEMFGDGAIGSILNPSAGKFSEDTRKKGKGAKTGASHDWRSFYLSQCDWLKGSHMAKVVWLPNETDYSYCEFVAPNTPY